MERILFYSFSALAILTALMVVLSRKPVISVLFLVITMFSLATLFALLGAHFLAVMQILIYAGAVLVLFLFVVMMLDLGEEGKAMRQSSAVKILGWITAIAFVLQMAFLFSAFPVAAPAHLQASEPGSIQAIGRLLFSDHLLAFELTSFLMLAAIIGAVVLSKKKWS